MPLPLRLPLLLSALSIFGLAALGACGDDGDDGPKTLSTGVDRMKTLGSTSQAEQQKICMATQEFAKTAFDQAKIKEMSCRISGMLGALLTSTDEQARMSCRNTYDMCKAAPAGPAMMGACGTFMASCNATVADYEACLNDFNAALPNFVNALPSCDMLTRASFTMLPALLGQLPASCQTYSMKCPGGFGNLPGVPPGVGSFGAGAP
jgi:hypothetical protein